MTHKIRSLWVFFVYLTWPQVTADVPNLIWCSNAAYIWAVERCALLADFRDWMFEKNRNLEFKDVCHGTDVEQRLAFLL